MPCQRHAHSFVTQQAAANPMAEVVLQDVTEVAHAQQMCMRFSWRDEVCRDHHARRLSGPGMLVAGRHASLKQYTKSNQGYGKLIASVSGEATWYLHWRPPRQSCLAGPAAAGV